MTCDNILVERRSKAGLVTLNRPQALNALSVGLVADLNHALAEFEKRPPRFSGASPDPRAFP